jgi:hypothetical protein
VKVRVLDAKLHELFYGAKQCKALFPLRFLQSHNALVLLRILGLELVLGAESVVDESKEAPGSELGEGNALLVAPNGDVGVHNSGRGEENERAGREFDYEVDVL